MMKLKCLGNAAGTLLFLTLSMASVANGDKVATTPPVVPTPGGIRNQTDATVRTSFLDLHPEGGLLSPGSRVRRAWGSRLAVGDSPSASATTFFQRWSVLWNVAPTDLQPIGPFENGTHVVELPNEDAKVGNLNAVYFTQTAANVPVYRAFGWAITRDDADFPVVLAGGTLRSVGNIANQITGLSLDTSKLDAGIFMQNVMPQFTTIPRVTSPRYVVWAGIDDNIQPARLGVQFIAETHGGPDEPNQQSFEYIVDPTDGTILYQENRILHAVVTGTVSGMVTNGKRADVCDPETSKRLPYTGVAIGSSTVYGDSNGNFTSGSISGSVAVQPSIANGKYFRVTNSGSTTLSVASQTVSSGSTTFTFNPVPTELQTAQTNAYYQANIVRDFTLRIAPNFPTIATQTGFAVNVNLGGTCNAFYNGSSINFYKSGGGCNNTSFSGVVHHEYGHHMVRCGGSGQDAFGEGFGDVMAVLILDDPMLGAGFQSCSTGIRNAANNCQYSGSSCSSCGSEIHSCGQLLSGIVWDLRQLYAARFASTAIDKVAALAINEVMLHSGQSDIAEDIRIDYLTLDDNNGNLGDGTPNSDLINEAFGRHGLAGVAVPANLLASDGTYTDRVRLTWSASTSATSYKISRSIGGGASAQIGTSTTTTFDDMTATPGTVYNYTVKAANSFGDSAASVANTGYVAATNGPTNLIASDGGFADKVALTWNVVANATGYKVRRWLPSALVSGTGSGFSISDNSTKTSVISLAAPTTALVSSVVIKLNSCTHTYQDDLTLKLTHNGITCILAQNCNSSTDLNGTYVIDDAAGTLFCQQPATGGTYRPSNSLTSAFANQPLTGDWSLTIQDSFSQDTGAISSWGITVNSVVSPEQIGTSTSNSFADTTATVATVFSYSVVATVANADTASSNIDSGWKNISAPTSVAATDGTLLDKVEITWGAVSGASGYKILRAIGSGTTTQIGTSSGTNFSDTSATPSTVYTYSVMSVGALGDGLVSATNTGFRGSLTAPTNVVASNGVYTDKVLLTWSAAQGASSYKILRGDSVATLSEIASTTATSYADLTAVAGTTYTYVVQSISSVGVSAQSNPVTGMRLLLPVLTLLASDGDYADKVNLSWNAVTNAASYRVYRTDSSSSKSGTGSGFNISDYSTSSSTIRINAPATDVSSLVKVTLTNLYHTWQGDLVLTLRHGAQQCVLASGCNGSTDLNGTYILSDSFTAAFCAQAGSGGEFKPANALQSKFASDTANGDWTLVLSDTAGGDIGSLQSWSIQITSVPVPVLIATIANTTYGDTSAVASTLYTYRVEAVTSANAAIVSGSDTGWRTLLGPTGLTASDGVYNDRVSAQWTAMSGAASYKIFRWLEGGSPVQIGTSVTNSYVDATAIAGGRYLYCVKAVMPMGDTLASASDEGYSAIGTPAILVASDGAYTNRVALTWGATAGASSYKVYRAQVSSEVATSGPGMNLPDVSAVSATLNVVPTDSTARVGAVTVSINNFRHTYQSDLIVTLSHEGKSCVLFSGCNGGTDMNGNYVLDDTATSLMCSQLATGGRYKPSNSLQSAFVNAAAAGAWTLTVQDTASADVGSIGTWAVNISTTSALASIATATTNSYSDSTAVAGVLYVYRVCAIIGGSETGFSNFDTGYSGSRSNFTGAGDGSNGEVVSGGATTSGEISMSGRGRWLAATRAGRRLAANGEVQAVEIDGAMLFEPISGSDPAWTIDCATETQESAANLIALGSQDIDDDGEPDLCQREFGDFDFNGVVDSVDLSLLLVSLGDMDLVFGDLNHDGMIDQTDVMILVQWMGDDAQTL